MPNWCNNFMSVQGSEKEVTKFTKQAEGKGPYGEDEILCCNNFIKMPQDAIDDYTNVGYFWQLENWGVKWGLKFTDIIDEDDNFISYQFDTAWGAAIPLIKQMIKDFPKLCFELEYDEYCNCFAGKLEGSNGEVTLEDEQSFNSEWGIKNYQDQDTWEDCKECEETFCCDTEEQYVFGICPRCMENKEKDN